MDVFIKSLYATAAKFAGCRSYIVKQLSNNSLFNVNL